MEQLLYVGIVQAAFTAVFVLTRRRVTLHDKVLAAWMTVIALPLLTGALARGLPDLTLPVLSANLVYPLTYGPFLWLYVGTLTGDIGRVGARQLVHFLPFVAVSLVQLLTGWSPPPPNPEVSDFDTATRLVGALNLALLLAYTVAVFRRLRRHGEEVLDHFSDLPNRVTLGWLRWITAGICAGFLAFFLATVLSLPDLLPVLLAVQIALILALSFFGLRQPQVFEREGGAGPEAETRGPIAVERPDPSRPEPATAAERAGPGPDRAPARYSRSGLTPERAAVISRRLDTFMEARKPYLDADLTIEKLARQMSVPRHHLTQVISERHGTNFYHFVTEHRIVAVKSALEDPANADRTLLDIAYAFGFNSKSTFNTAFKRLVGVTPSHYRARPD